MPPTTMMNSVTDLPRPAVGGARGGSRFGALPVAGALLAAGFSLAGPVVELSSAPSSGERSSPAAPRSSPASVPLSSSSEVAMSVGTIPESAAIANERDRPPGRVW
jgi:hypothetical protein